MSELKKMHSLERTLKSSFITQFILVTILISFVLFFSGASKLVSITILSVIICVYIPWLFYSYKNIVVPLDNLSNSLEALRHEDYSVVARSHYKTGVVAQLYADVAIVNSDLQQRKDRYNQDVYLIYRLIEKLGTPVIIINSKYQMTHANEAFDKWFGQPWQTIRGLNASRLGLTYEDNNEWQFIDKSSHKGWQIKSSVFLDGKDDYQLLMLNNIEQEVRETQQEAWQQIIRILSHEIRNSLTPIQSLSQSLLAMEEIEKQPKKALQVIYDRSHSLQEFVSRYATMTRSFEINIRQFHSQDLFNKLSRLFDEYPIEIEADKMELYADQVLLEQVLINLLRNAIESSKQKNATEENQAIQPIIIKLEKSKQTIIISIKDRGMGISNQDNLFVPFYTTKENGQGIGLFFCRNIIEKHGGKLTLESRAKGGAKATISLPWIVASHTRID